MAEAVVRDDWDPPDASSCLPALRTHHRPFRLLAIHRVSHVAKMGSEVSPSRFRLGETEVCLDPDGLVEEILELSTDPLTC